MNTRRHVVVAVWALVAAGAGCGREAPRVDVEPALSERLKAMPAAEQLATLRPLVRADTLDPDLAFYSGNAYYALGTGYPPEQSGAAAAYFDSAIAEYRRAIDADSTMSKAWVNMGLAMEAKGSHDDARTALQSAIAVNPRDVLAYCHLGYLEHQGGDLAEAIRLYRQALSIDANSAQAHYNLGLAFAETRVFKEALVEWETVMRLDPDGELGRTAADNVRIIKQYLETP
jgi:tetratricopeptide (TPR) repeat protein